MPRDCGESAAQKCPPMTWPHTSPGACLSPAMNVPNQFSGVGSRVPDDIWNLVFGLLHASRESVTNVSLSCSRFYTLTVPLIFQRLNFHHSRLENARELCKSLRARSTVLWYVQEVDIDWIAWNNHRMVASEAPPCIRQILYTLPNLRVLSFSGTVITTEGALLLATRPNIQRLSISSSCRLSPDLHRNLPGTRNRGLEHLTIGDMEYNKPEDLIAWLHLLLGPDLRDLHVLGGLGTGRFFIECLLQELVPGSLQRLHLEHANGALLYEIIAKQSRLEGLHFYCSEPPPPTDSRLHPSLRSWSGPSNLAAHFMPGSNIDTVRFWMQQRADKSEELKYNELMPLYHNAIKLAEAPLRCLEMLHIEWDQCIFDHLPILFPTLEKFSVYFLDRPDMDYLEEQFPQKLALMTHLRYLATHTEATTPTLRPMHDLGWAYMCLQLWSVQCPSLREVEFRAMNLWVDWIWLAPGDWRGYMKGENFLHERELAKLHIYPS